MTISAEPMLVAFYLPQFHAIAENDRKYGVGFTEWDNVRRAVPLFHGHMQPHVPHRCLGYYSLLDEKFLQFQHELAYSCGVRAFCYYYYNFSGHKLLYRPIDLAVGNPALRNAFCLCWAHMSWHDNRENRTEDNLFLPQVYSEDNAVRMAADMMHYFRSPRHIFVDGKPLFLIWAPEKNPMMAEYAGIWREAAKKAGFAGVYLVGVEAYMEVLPEMLGLDCMLEFAPNWTREALISASGEQPKLYDYLKTLRFMREKPLPSYHRLRCAFPGWDNTPRRGKKGIVFVNEDPEAFREQLCWLVRYTREVLPRELQYVFINAWNEWGEGCHLEPDKRQGFTLLKIVRECLEGAVGLDTDYI
ncbi:MAG: glycoside hydrolase family 99-like domain-containing protein [Desulfovibrio sp.]|nr:glycoside hydrolase family 99-like domain-containing protein [Desulfovibrio sp.]